MFLLVLLIGAGVRGSENEYNKQLDIEQRMVIAMDTCIEYMTLAMQCDPPKKKLEKVRLIMYTDIQLVKFSIPTDWVGSSSTPFTTAASENVEKLENDGRWIKTK